MLKHTFDSHNAPTEFATSGITGCRASFMRVAQLRKWRTRIYS